MIKLPEYLGYNNNGEYFGSDKGSHEEDFKKRWHNYM
jgi:hypothetical protein